MFVLNENESEALAYNDITSISVVETKAGFLIKVESEENAMVLARFNDRPKLGAIISSMWYANLRGKAMWKIGDEL